LIQRIWETDIALGRPLDRRLVLENAAYKLQLELLVEERAKALNDVLEDLSEIHGPGFETLAMALDLQDQGTSGHSRRVADLTRDIAQNLGITNGELEQIEHGALLHDIGKLRIPDSILWKPAELNPEEWQIMRRHPRYGYEFVKDIEFLDKGAADIILSHHEKFDGSGYPRGLKGEEISLGARIFSVVDAMDAIVHDRPYHRGSTFPVACEEVIRNAGTHFDPELIEPALSHMENYLEIPL
jgi:putative nucleotidyltransferase with HDIG domain